MSQAIEYKQHKALTSNAEKSKFLALNRQVVGSIPTASTKATSWDIQSLPRNQGNPIISNDLWPICLSGDVHFLFLYVDLWILPLDRRNDRRVFRLSAGPGQRISRVRSILNRVAPRLGIDKLPLGQFLPLVIRKLCHSDFTRPSCFKFAPR